MSLAGKKMFLPTTVKRLDRTDHQNAPQQYLELKSNLKNTNTRFLFTMDCSEDMSFNWIPDYSIHRCCLIIKQNTSSGSWATNFHHSLSVTICSLLTDRLMSTGKKHKLCWARVIISTRRTLKHKMETCYHFGYSS